MSLKSAFKINIWLKRVFELKMCNLCSVCLTSVANGRTDFCLKKNLKKSQTHWNFSKLVSMCLKLYLVTALLPDIDNPGYFPPILGIFGAVFDNLRVKPGYLPPTHCHIVIHCRCLPITSPPPNPPNYQRIFWRFYKPEVALKFNLKML